MTSNGRCSSPNWRDGTYSSLKVWVPEKSGVARRKHLKWNFLIWSHFFPVGLPFTRCRGYICTAALNTPRSVLGRWQEMNCLTHRVTLSPPAQSGCRQTASWEWSLGCANSQTIPADWDIRMCWQLARSSSSKLTIQMIKFQRPGTFLGTVTDIPQQNQPSSPCSGQKALYFQPIANAFWCLGHPHFGFLRHTRSRHINTPHS